MAALPAPTVSTLPLVFLASHRPSGQPTLTATSRLPTDASVGQPPNAAPWDPGQQVGPLPGLLPTWQRDIASRKSGKWTPQRVGGRDCLVKLISPSTRQAPARAVEAYGLPDTLRQLGRARLLQGSFSGLTTGPPPASSARTASPQRTSVPTHGAAGIIPSWGSAAARSPTFRAPDCAPATVLALKP